MIPERFKARCHFCGDEIDTRRKAGHFNFGSGWFQQRSEGGAHAVALPRMDPTMWACKWCVDQKRAGAAHYQASLFG